MTDDRADIVDWALFEKNRAELGPGFIKIISYFREDGAKSVAQIEQAMREENTVGLVFRPTPSRASLRQLGAEPLAKIADSSNSPRACAWKPSASPTSSCRKSSRCAACSQTVALFDKATNPLVTCAAPGGFGRRVANQDFGRI